MIVWNVVLETLWFYMLSFKFFYGDFIKFLDVIESNCYIKLNETASLQLRQVLIKTKNNI